MKLFILLVVVLLITALPLAVAGCAPVGCNCACFGLEGTVTPEEETPLNIWVFIGSGLAIAVVAAGVAYYLWRRRG